MTELWVNQPVWSHLQTQTKSPRSKHTFIWRGCLKWGAHHCLDFHTGVGPGWLTACGDVCPSQSNRKSGTSSVGRAGHRANDQGPRPGVGRHVPWREEKNNRSTRPGLWGKRKRWGKETGSWNIIEVHFCSLAFLSGVKWAVSWAHIVCLTVCIFEWWQICLHVLLSCFHSTLAERASHPWPSGMTFQHAARSKVSNSLLTNVIHPGISQHNITLKNTSEHYLTRWCSPFFVVNIHTFVVMSVTHM